MRDEKGRFIKGQSSPRKGMITTFCICNGCRIKFVPKDSCKRKYCSRECKTKNYISWNRGKKFPRELSNSWKGGFPNCKDCGIQLTTRKNKTGLCIHCAGLLRRKEQTKRDRRHRDMRRKEYIIWRTAVFMRDNYICQKCGKRGVYLEADHIKPWALYPELRYAIDNGRTLCRLCHLKTETWGYRSIYKEID